MKKLITSLQLSKNSSFALFVENQTADPNTYQEAETKIK
jgi:hypothetical protein